MLIDDDLRIDVVDSLLCDIDLVLSVCFSCRQYLSIDIGKAD